MGDAVGIIQTKLCREVVQFIQHFSDAHETFLHGCCYWFTLILLRRFRKEIAEAMLLGYVLYEPIEGHFIFGIGDYRRAIGKNDDHFRYFDIRGDVTDLYKGKDLYTLRYMMKKMPKYYEHLMRDCRDFLPPDEEEQNE